MVNCVSAWPESPAMKHERSALPLLFSSQSHRAGLFREHVQPLADKPVSPDSSVSNTTPRSSTTSTICRRIAFGAGHRDGLELLLGKSWFVLKTPGLASTPGTAANPVSHLVEQSHLRITGVWKCHITRAGEVQSSAVPMPITH